MTQSPKWLSDDPNDYLHPEHHALGTPIPVDWQNDYGRWRHCYMPGLREEVSRCFPAINCARFSKMVKPLLEIAFVLVPNNVKACVAQNNPDDWTKLPDMQISRAWKNEKILFANAYLALICFQIAVFIKDGKLKGLSLSKTHDVEGLGKMTTQNVLEQLLEIDDEYSNTHAHRLSIHLSVFQMATPRPALWSGIAGDYALRESFQRDTGQHNAKVLADLEEGHLISLATAQRITKWLKEAMKNEPAFGWSYKHMSAPRPRAANGERVEYCGRDTKFGTKKA